MKKVLLLLPFLASCQATRPAGEKIADVSVKIVETAMIPDNYIEDRHPKVPFPVKCIVRPVTIPIMFGGLVVATPVFVTGILLQGPQTLTPEERHAQTENENAAIAFRILTTPN